MFKTIKVKLNPKPKQIEFFEKNSGCKRFVYNWGLALQKELYDETGDKFTANELIIKLPDLKYKYPWLRDADSTSLQNALKDLDTAYKNFFSSCNGSRKGRKVSFPKFKSKRKSRQSFRINCVNNNIKIVDNFLKLPKIGNIKVWGGHRQLHRFDSDEPIIKYATISKDSDNCWYASILVDVLESENMAKSTGITAGLDLGLKDFCISNNGFKSSFPDKFNKLLKRLEQLHKQYSSKYNKYKKTGYYSNNLRKSKTKLAKCYYKIKCLRKNFHHQLSTLLVQGVDILTIETLNISGMLKNRKLSRKISLMGWYDFTNMLEYKFKWNHKILIKVDSFFPSTKTCSVCHTKNNNLTLKDREWDCTNCNTHHDRDINAAKVLNNVSLYFKATGEALTTASQYSIASGVA
jgi:putative transposase